MRLYIVSFVAGIVALIVGLFASFKHGKVTANKEHELKEMKSIIKTSEALDNADTSVNDADDDANWMRERAKRARSRKPS